MLCINKVFVLISENEDAIILDDGSKHTLKKRARRKKLIDSDDEGLVDEDEEEEKKLKRKLKNLKKNKDSTEKKKGGRPRKIKVELVEVKKEKEGSNKEISNGDVTLNLSESENKYLCENESNVLSGNENGYINIKKENDDNTDNLSISSIDKSLYSVKPFADTPRQEKFIEQYVSFIKKRGRPPGSKNKVKKEKDVNSEDGKVKIKRKRKPKQPKNIPFEGSMNAIVGGEAADGFLQQPLTEGGNFIQPNPALRMFSPEESNGNSYYPHSQEHDYSLFPQDQAQQYQSQQHYPVHSYPYQMAHYNQNIREQQQDQLQLPNNQMLSPVHNIHQQSINQTPIQNHPQMQSVSPIHNQSFVQSQNLDRYAMQTEAYSQPMKSPVQNYSQNQYQSLNRSPVQSQCQVQNQNLDQSPIHGMAQMTNHMMRSPIQNQMQSPPQNHMFSPNHMNNSVNQSPTHNHLPHVQGQTLHQSPIQNQPEMPNLSINRSPLQNQLSNVQSPICNQPEMPNLTKNLLKINQSHQIVGSNYIQQLSQNQQSNQHQTSSQAQSPQSQTPSPQSVAIINMKQSHVTYKNPVLLAVSGRITPIRNNSPAQSPVARRIVNTPNSSPQSGGSSPLQSLGKLQTHAVISNVSSLLTAGKPFQIRNLSPQQRVICLKVPSKSLNGVRLESDSCEVPDRTFTTQNHGFYSSNPSDGQLHVQSESDRQIFNMDHGTVISETSSCRVESVQSLPVNLDRHENQCSQWSRLPKLESYQTARSEANFPWNTPQNRKYSILTDRYPFKSNLKLLVYFFVNEQGKTPNFHSYSKSILSKGVV